MAQRQRWRVNVGYSQRTKRPLYRYFDTFARASKFASRVFTRRNIVLSIESVPFTTDKIVTIRQGVVK